jgi:hypothetical protein
MIRIRVQQTDILSATLGTHCSKRSPSIPLPATLSPLEHGARNNVTVGGPKAKKKKTTIIRKSFPMINRSSLSGSSQSVRVSVSVLLLFVTLLLLLNLTAIIFYTYVICVYSLPLYKKYMINSNENYWKIKNSTAIRCPVHVRVNCTSDGLRTNALADCFVIVSPSEQRCTMAGYNTCEYRISPLSLLFLS